MSNRLAFSIAVLILLAGFFLRAYELASLPPGLNEIEVTDARIAETVRQGRAEIFFSVDGIGREGTYPAALAAFTALTGGGTFTLRLFSVFLGMLALAATYALGKRLFGAPAGLAGMALLAVLMLPIVLSRAVAAESFAPFHASMVFLLMARAYPMFGRPMRSEPTVTTFAMLGGLLGLGFYITPMSFVIAMTSVLFIGYLVVTRQPMPRRVYSFTWFALVIMIVVATPYLIASLQNPAIAGAGRVFSSRITTLIPSVLAGLNGLLFVGDRNVIWNLPERPLLDLVSGVLMLLGLVLALRSFRQPRFMLIVIASAICLPPVLITDFSPNFLRFGVLLPLLAVLVGLGVTALYRSLRSDEARVVFVVALAGLVLFNIQWTARDLFGAWPRLQETQTAYHGRVGDVARYLDATVRDTTTVVCTGQLRQNAGVRQLTNLQLMVLMMHQQDATIRFADCGSGIVFPNAGEVSQIVFLEPRETVNVPAYVVRWLERGTVIRHPLLPDDMTALRLDVAGVLADTLGLFTTSAPVAYAPETLGGMDVTAPPVRFGGNLALLGYVQTWAATSRPGDLISVPTYWRIDGQLPNDLVLFAHVQVDPAALPAAQTDTLAVLPDSLLPRDIVLQNTYLTLPFTLPAGNYSLSIGAYERNSGARLPVYDGDDERGTRVFIGEISVAAR